MQCVIVSTVYWQKVLFDGVSTSISIRLLDCRLVVSSNYDALAGPSNYGSSLCQIKSGFGDLSATYSRKAGDQLPQALFSNPSRRLSPTLCKV